MVFGRGKPKMQIGLKLRTYFREGNTFIFFLILLSTIFTSYALLLSVRFSEQTDSNNLTQEALIFQRNLQEEIAELELQFNTLAMALKDTQTENFHGLSFQTFRVNPHLERIELRDESCSLIYSAHPAGKLISEPRLDSVLPPSAAFVFSKVVEQQKSYWALRLDTSGKMFLLLISPSGEKNHFLVAHIDVRHLIDDLAQNKLPATVQVAIREKSESEIKPSSAVDLNMGLTGLNLQLTFKPSGSRQEKGNPSRIFIILLGLSLITLLIRFNKEITNSKKSRNQLAIQEMALAKQAQLSTLGEISTTLAHELNQPLATITNYIATCEIRLRQLGIGDPQLEKALSDARGQALRAADIVVSIRKFLQKGNSTKSRVEIERSISDLMPILKSLIKEKRAALTLRTEPQLYIYVDPALFEQILFNICRNGLDAMTDTPVELRKLTIGTHRVQLENGDFCIQIDVEDAGHGISSMDAQKIFVPFFTTKSEGMGIGLSLVKSMTERHGGRIFWKANTDRGVTFTIQFPQYINPT